MQAKMHVQMQNCHCCNNALFENKPPMENAEFEPFERSIINM